MCPTIEKIIKLRREHSSPNGRTKFLSSQCNKRFEGWKPKDLPGIN